MTINYLDSLGRPLGVVLFFTLIVISGCNEKQNTESASGEYDLVCKYIKSNFYLTAIRCENKEVFCYQVQGSGNFSCLKKDKNEN